MITPDDRPRLAPGVRLADDTSRGGKVLLAPERVVRLDPVAADIVGRIDGATPVADIASALASAYDGDAATIAADVIELLDALAEKGLVLR